MLNVFFGQGNKTKTLAVIQSLLTLAAQFGYLDMVTYTNISTALALAFGITVADGATGYPRPK